MLYSVDDKLMRPIGTEEHWDIFRRFRDHELHRLFIEKIEELVQDVLSPTSRREGISSKRDGAIVLRQFPSSVPALFAREFPGIYDGALWGMTLWNHLAEADTHWVFVPQEADEFGWETKWYWPKTNIEDDQGQ